ncbi:glycerate kinase [Sedimentibacter hydroxybenzoicus DSM 7310]|uniref:Glycerate kinase n=1 Tax=Sedimentibacter hydroxybenzoicus DSM 7310 TaxID=1123245 RepID=A0A974BKM8_SEDHY|nr:glycerate kinase [Sedimentibacter hydroxybenzoicus]NYB74758.1 glycerate kinase [Sedimentibacter hydroxybenzoicus DSM 7310]
MTIREDAFVIIQESIKAVLPQAAVIKALEKKNFSGDVTVVAVGKAAWTMAFAAKEKLGDKVLRGIIVTKYAHSKGPIEGFEIIEAGHPVPDENSVIGAAKALELVKNLDENDDVIFLVSGGGSAIFEKPMEGIELEDIMDITNQLLSSGADIVEINTIRKHLSDVKGGRFALHCKANIFSVVLSDVLGDRLDSIASGPAYPDSSTSQQALEIVEKYKLKVNEKVLEALKTETPKEINNCETVITGSVSELCSAASSIAKSLGYQPLLLTSTLDCEAKEAGRFMASVGREIRSGNGLATPIAVIAGGETVVHIRGKGKGGRNQELCLSAAIGIEGLNDTVIFSVGSDGTDGPTDAAGGIVDGETASKIRSADIQPEVYLDNNDSYNALKVSGDLVITGSTGTNVNDLTVLLCK